MRAALAARTLLALLGAAPVGAGAFDKGTRRKVDVLADGEAADSTPEWPRTGEPSSAASNAELGHHELAPPALIAGVKTCHCKRKDVPIFTSALEEKQPPAPLPWTRREQRRSHSAEMVAPTSLAPAPPAPAAARPGRNPHFNVTWLVVSENMPDILRIGLACNKDLMHRVVVLTSPIDEHTLQVCRDVNAVDQRVECHPTEALHLNGDVFNKGRALREAQAAEHRKSGGRNDSAILIMDQDICAPLDIWTKVPATLKTGTLYSVLDRCIYSTPEDAIRGIPTRQEHYTVTPSMGFFQLYVGSADAPVYSDEYKTAAVSDLKYADVYGKKAAALPLVLNHLGEPARDWNGHRGGTAAWASVRLPANATCPCCTMDAPKPV